MPLPPLKEFRRLLPEFTKLLAAGVEVCVNVPDMSTPKAEGEQGFVVLPIALPVC
jgi:hypothetical protein